MSRINGDAVIPFVWQAALVILICEVLAVWIFTYYNTKPMTT
jgi:hypothetical protein